MTNAFYAVVQTKLREVDSSEEESLLVSYMMGTTPPTLPKRNMRPAEMHVVKMWRGWIEIFRAAESLEMIAKYFAQDISRPRSISRPHHLRLHFEWYLSEFYILQCRLQSFLNIIEHSYRKELSAAETKAIKTLREGITNLTTNAVKARGEHVHHERYDDHDLSRLFALELMTRWNKLLRPYMQKGLSEVRERKMETLRSNRATIRSLLVGYFNLLYRILFRKGGELRIPARLNVSSNATPAR